MSLIRWIVLIALFTVVACSRQAVDFPGFPVAEDSVADQIRATQEAFELASTAKKRSNQKLYAREGMNYAARCSELAPDNAACYFYAAVNTGLYYEARVIGYPTGMIRISEAAQKVIDLDPAYEQGGGYRILGKLYLEAPSFNLGSNEITRDLEKSHEYLEKAVTDYPDYPENHLFFAEVLAASKQKDLAREHLDIAVAQIEAGDYPSNDRKEWDKTIAKLRKKIGRGS